MIVKKYIAKDMNEAMGKIKLDLGNEAVIIARRYIRKSGIAGIFSKKILEVTAAKENSNEEFSYENNDDTISSLTSIMSKELESRSVGIKEFNSNRKTERLEKDLNEVKGLLYKFIEEKSNNIFNDLDLIDDLEKVISEERDVSVVKNRLNDIINISQDEVKGKMVIVGPTGVGKTTTIAKLAGKLALIDKKKVGLITIDTYRIGAVEQLRTYAEIMNIPFRVVMSLNEMDSALNSMKNCDVILIDSTGRNSKNIMQLSELRAFIDKIKPTNMSLVISATTKNEDLKSILDGYSSLGYKDLIITKLDETTTYGIILNAAYLSKVPIRYFTNGQNVPDDIKEPSKAEIINLVLGDKKEC